MVIDVENVILTVGKGIEKFAEWINNMRKETLKTLNEGRKAVVRARMRRRLSRLKHEFRRAKFTYTSDASRIVLGANLGLDVKKPVTDTRISRRLRNISLRSLLQKEAKVPGTLMNAFVQKIEKEGDKNVMRQMDYGSLLLIKEGDTLFFDLTRNWSVYQNVGFQKFFEHRPDIFQIYVKNTYRGRSGLAQRNPKNGNFYYVRPDGSQGPYAEIFKGYVEIVKTVPSKDQVEASKGMVAATRKRRERRRLRQAAKGVPEAYKASPEKQREFEQRLKEIKETRDRRKLIELAKKYRESASDSEPIVQYPNKYDLNGNRIKARTNTLLVYACFEQSIKLLNEQTGSHFKVNLWSSLRTIATQRRIRERTEAAQIKDVTAEYKKKFAKKGMDEDAIKKELAKPKIKEAIRREGIRRASYLAAKAAKSHHLTGGALDISVTEEYEVTIKGKKRKRVRNLTNYTFKVDYNKNQTPALIRKAIAGDKDAYKQLNSHNRKSARAAIALYKRTGMRDIYPPKTDISSELWHKNIGKGVYKVPELVAKKRIPQQRTTPTNEPSKKLSSLLERKDHVPAYIRTRREWMYRQVEAHKGDFDVKWFESRDINGGRPVYVTKIGPNNGKFVPGAPTKVITYFHGHGDPRTKMLALLKNRWNREVGMNGLREVANEGRVNIVLIVAEGNNNKSCWPELQNAEKFKRFVETSLEYAGVSPTHVTDRYMIGHSGASYFMRNPLKRLPKDYFAGLGLADTLYGVGVGSDYYNSIRGIMKERKFKIFARYLWNGPKIDKKTGKKYYRYPWHNNNDLKRRLRRAIARGDFPNINTEEDIQFHHSKRQSHSQIKASVLRDAMRLFVLGRRVV